MQTNRDPWKLVYGGRRSGARAQSILARLLAVTAGVVLLIGAIAISVVLFAIALTGVLVFGLYFWWKTRELRKQVRSWPPDSTGPSGGTIIEGEVISKTTEKTERP